MSLAGLTLREALQQTAGRWPKAMFGEVSPRAAQLARAEAMGFDTSRTLYHGTHSAFDSFKPSRGATDSFIGLSDEGMRHRRASYGDGVYVSTTPSRANDFAGMHDEVPDGGNVVPMYARRGAFRPTIGKEGRVVNPRDLRSIFAEFDPAKAGSADLLAGLAIAAPVGAITLREALRGRLMGEA